MTHLVILPILLPLAAAVACTLMRSSIQAQRLVSLSAALTLIPVAWLLLDRAAHGDIDVYALGGWRAPFWDRVGARPAGGPDDGPLHHARIARAFLCGLRRRR